MTHTKEALGILVIAAVLSLTYFALSSPKASASGQPGLIVGVATSSNPTLTTTAGILFATSTCSARIVTTVASPIMLTFSDFIGQTPTALFGHLQAASTTIVYDAEKYGCGSFKAYSFTTATVTVTETR